LKRLKTPKEVSHDFKTRQFLALLGLKNSNASHHWLDFFGFFLEKVLIPGLQLLFSPLRVRGQGRTSVYLGLSCP
jgi:hypothetical protein